MAVPSNSGLEIKHLRTLTALAEQGSLAGAAQSLNQQARELADAVAVFRLQAPATVHA